MAWDIYPALWVALSKSLSWLEVSWNHAIPHPSWLCDGGRAPIAFSKEIPLSVSLPISLFYILTVHEGFKNHVNSPWLSTLRDVLKFNLQFDIHYISYLTPCYTGLGQMLLIFGCPFPILEWDTKMLIGNSVGISRTCRLMDSTVWYSMLWPFCWETPDY